MHVEADTRGEIDVEPELVAHQELLEGFTCLARDVLRRGPTRL